MLLSRYSGQEDIGVGTPIAGRTAPRWSRSSASSSTRWCCAQTSPADPTFVELLEQSARGVLWERTRIRTCPFEKLVEELQPERSLSHTPLFQVMFALQNAPGEALDLPELRLSRVSTETRTAKFDLTLSLSEASDSLAGAIEYNTDLFDAETISRMLGHFHHLLTAIAADPQRLVRDLPLLPDSEHQQLLHDFNDTAAAFPSDLCLHQLFEEQVARTPASVALVYEDEEVSYHELNLRAEALAHHLRSLGVRPEVRVGILVERSVEMVMAVLGILKAGGAYVPLDPEYPAERLRFMLEDAEVSVLITQRRLVRSVTEHGARVCYLDDEAEGSVWQKPEEELAREEATAENLAYVIYTSGSTGTPKGVAIAHRSAVTLVYWAQSQFSPESLSGVLASTSLCFDLSVFEIFAPLSCGGCIIVAADALHLPTLRHADAVRLVNTVPSAMAELVRMRALPPSVRTVNLAGEALKAQLAADVYAVQPSVSEVLNLYGPTEDTTYSTWAVVGRGAEGSDPPIGRPVANTQAYVLDSWMHLVPVGVPGELYLGGEGLARGYLGRADLTADRFVPDPYGGETGARLYRTGDIVRRQADGTLLYLGRADQQVKVRGYRIELGEIEAVLREQAGVRECVVVAAPHSSGSPRLVAYVVGEDGSLTGEVGRWREQLSQQLPQYMVPSAWVMLEQLPLTPNGKIDRGGLPAAGESSRGGVEGWERARRPTEELLAGIWAEVLGVREVGLHDNFFELGGHSLLATQIISRVRKAFKVELALRSLFELPTVGEMASGIEESLKGEQGVASPPVLAVARDADLPLSFAQQRLWFLDQLEPGNPVYNIPLAARLTGDLDMAALGRTLDEIVRRHESLRTIFREEDGRPLQVISPSEAVPLPLTDLSFLPEDVRESEARRIAQQESQRPFDLARGPLLRAGLLKLAEQEHIVLLTMHHIVSDGWSLGVLLSEVAALYTAFSRGEASSLAELPIQYADYAVWQREWLRGDVLDKQLSYWRQHLEGAPALLKLPTDRPRPPIQSFHGAGESFELSEALTASLRELSRRENVTLFMTLLAAFQLLLHRYTGQKDVVVGAPIAGRTRVETESLIGFFVNTLALRGRLTPEMTFEELLRQAREATLGAYAHQDVPFERLVEELQQERSLDHSPLFQVMLVLQNAPGGELELPGLRLSAVGSEGVTAKFDLSLLMTEAGGGLAASLVYNTDLFDAGTVRRMASHFERLLTAAVADPALRISEMPLLGSEEERRLLLDFNDTHADYPQECVHELFEEQVERTPEAVAVSFEGEQLTYAELNRRANQLAHHLRHFGVRTEVLVAIYMERSLDLAVALMGVLKAGGAYVPLDPSYPRERLAFIFEDTHSPVVLTQRALAESQSFEGARVLCLDDDTAGINAESRENPQSGVTQENMAYVIYTSGSTGQPKGAMLHHRGVRNRLLWGIRDYGLGEGDVVLHKTPLSFDVSVWEIFAPLLSGARLVIAKPGGHQDSAYQLDLIASQGVTHIDYVPSMMQVFLEEEKGLKNCTALKLVTCAGEVLSPELRDRFYARTDAKLYNVYGPTETSVGVTYWICEPDAKERLIPIGRPMSNVRIYILDKHLQPVPIGVAGELHIGGEAPGRGYLKRPELTADKFIPDAFSARGGERLYKTGDLARYRADGAIEFLGRLDHQVKVRGMRLELGEVEAVLRGHAGVQDCAVVAREDVAGGKRLVAYVVGEQAATVDVVELRRHMGKRLPDYMVPSAWVMLEELPLTPSGKVDRRVLPEPDQLRPELEQAFVAPRTPAEEVIAGIWSEVLGVEQVGVHDNFFELGGHSLLVTQVMSRVRKVFQMEIPLRSLFESATVGGLVEVLSGLCGSREAIEEIAQTFIEVEQLSDENVEVMLTELELSN